MQRFLDTTEFKDTKTFSGACHRMPTLTTGLSATRQKRTFLLVIYQKVTRQKCQKVYAKFTQGTVEFANRVTMCIFDEE